MVLGVLRCYSLQCLGCLIVGTVGLPDGLGSTRGSAGNVAGVQGTPQPPQVGRWSAGLKCAHCELVDLLLSIPGKKNHQ